MLAQRLLHHMLNFNLISEYKKKKGQATVVATNHSILLVHAMESMNYNYKSSTQNEIFSKRLIKTNLKLRSCIFSYFNDPLCSSIFRSGKAMEVQTLVVHLYLRSLRG